MRFLLTNDDGFDSRNLQVMKEVLEEYGDVTIIAPLVEQSGAGVSGHYFHPLDKKVIDEKTIAIGGTPADCVSYALGNHFDDFDIVISGPNNGLNMTYDIVHSGTCGACIESLLMSKPAIAFSFEWKVPAKKEMIKRALDYILEHNLISKDYFINVNFPTVEREKGIKITTVGNRNDRRYFLEDETSILAKREVVDWKLLPENTDVYAVNDGYISLTPLGPGFHSKELYNFILDKVK